MQRRSIRMFALFGAITVCFCVYSLIQERLMTVGFGAEGEHFRHSLFVILVNRIVTMAVATAGLALTGHSIRPAAPLVSFSVPSIANVVASAAQYEALKYVSFPLQALAKCAKTVPVMVWGLMIGGTSYGSEDYWCSALVTAGCAIFVLTGNIAAPSVAAASASHPGDPSSLPGFFPSANAQWAVYGSLLLAAFLLFDGLASSSQDRLFSKYTMHSCSQLLWVTAWSAGVSFIMLVATGQLAAALSFVSRHPDCLGLMLALSLLSTAAQLFIFFTIQQYGALRFALMMTVRQFLSIVLSCLVFSHSLSPAQWTGTALVIGALVQRAQVKAAVKKSSPAKVQQGAAGKPPRDLGPLIPVIHTNQAPSPKGQNPVSPARLNHLSPTASVSLEVDGRVH